MVRPRFHKLPLAQQRDILTAALDEFAAHGFNAASLNRIIEAAGISKGSMYYYFDDKKDLYVHVASVELGRLLDTAGPFPIPTARDPQAFWSTMESYYLRIMAALVASPGLAALARDWLVASASHGLKEAQEEMEQASLPWFEQALAEGQRIDAVRKDVPMALLIAVVFGMGQAMDEWLLMQAVDDASLTGLVRKLVGMIQRAVAP